MNKFGKIKKTTNKSYHQMALRLGLEIYNSFIPKALCICLLLFVIELSSYLLYLQNEVCFINYKFRVCIFNVSVTICTAKEKQLTLTFLSIFQLVHVCTLANCAFNFDQRQQRTEEK